MIVKVASMLSWWWFRWQPLLWWCWSSRIWSSSHTQLQVTGDCHGHGWSMSWSHSSISAGADVVICSGALLGVYTVQGTTTSRGDKFLSFRFWPPLVIHISLMNIGYVESSYIYGCHNSCKYFSCSVYSTSEPAMWDHFEKNLIGWDWYLPQTRAPKQTFGILSADPGKV